MTEQGCGSMRPLYEAMAVCSSTIEWLEREEQKREAYDFQSCVAKLIKALEEFITSVGRGIPPGEKIPAPMLTGLVWCVDTLNSMAQLAVRKSRELLPTFAVEFRDAVGSLLTQVDALTDKVEDILEAWQMGANAEVASALEQMVGQIDNGKKDIPDWRESLELILSD